MDQLIDSIRDFIHGNGIQAFVIALVILLLTLIVSAVLARLMRKLMHTDISPFPSSSILINIVRITVWAAGLTIMLSACFNVNVNGMLAALGVGGIAVSLGLQNTIQNFIGGLLITVMKIIKPGDHIIVSGIEGIVQDVSWRQTMLLDLEGNEHLIPNMIISSAAIEKVEPENLIITPIVFSYSEGDPQLVVEAMEKKAKTAIEEVTKLKVDPWILLTGIQNGALAGTMRFVLADSSKTREARNAAIRAMAPYSVAGTMEKLAPMSEDGDGV